jgi:hypothetical protein
VSDAVTGIEHARVLSRLEKLEECAAVLREPTQKLVPREPTPEMLNAGGKFSLTLRDAWVDMYDAAPRQPEPPQETPGANCLYGFSNDGPIENGPL